MPTEDIKLELCNALGKKVYETADFESNTTKTIDLTAFSKGIYFMKITDGKNSHTEKIILE